MLIPELDQASTRGSASGVAVDPSGARQIGEDTRQYRIIKRSLVRGLAPPEHGGVLNLPSSLQTVPGASARVQELIALLTSKRRSLGLPELKSFWVDEFGAPTPIDLG